MTWSEQVAARTLWQEARGEPLIGQQAVAWVIRNRLATGTWGKSLASVCLWRAQFSGWYMPSDPNFAAACDLANNDPTLLALTKVLSDVMSADRSQDPTGGATSYYAVSMTTPPAWAASMTFCGRFGNQLFLKTKEIASA